MDNLVGKLCRGFKFEYDATKDLSWLNEMESYVGSIGEIEDITDDGCVKVRFSNNEYCWYPLDQIKDNLVDPCHLYAYMVKCSSCGKTFGTNNKRNRQCTECYIVTETIASQKILTPLEKFMNYLIQNQYYIGNGLLAEYKKLMEEEKERFE
jgi:hypothetical protein